MEELERVLPGLVARVRGVRTIDAAVDEIATTFRDRWDLWRVSIIIFTDDGKGRFMAQWSVGDTLFSPGTEVPLDFNDGVRDAVADLIRGRPVVIGTAEKRFGLLGDMLQREGIASGVGIPLREDGVVLGLLALASFRPDAFGAEDIAALRTIAMALETRLVELAYPSKP